jgi:mercuric ion transport protein
MAPKSERLPLIGGALAALGASACCVLPLVLVTMGLGGAWLSYATALEPYRLWFVALTIGLLGYAFWALYLRNTVPDGEDCAEEVCASGPSTRAQVVFWTISVVAGLLLAFPWYATWLLT